jgi:Spy/CpxP family protein refolding chaperone
LPGRFNWWQLLLGIAAGLLVGFAASTFAYRFRILRVPGRGVIERMARDLKLTPEQEGRVEEIMRETHFKMMQQRRDLHRKRHRDFLEALRQIRSILTPEQQVEFDSEFLSPDLRELIERGRAHAQPSPSAAFRTPPSPAPPDR